MTENTTTQATTYERVTFDQVQPGDVLMESGLRLLCGERKRADWRPEVSWFATTILNVDYLQSEQGRYLFGGIIKLDGSETFTVQGSDLREVVREVRA